MKFPSYVQGIYIDGI